MTNYDFSEDTLVEQPAIELLAALGWETGNAYGESASAFPVTGRESRGEVVLRPRLHAALARLNPALPAEALSLAIEALTRARRAMTPARASQEIHALLKEGVKVAFRGEDGEERVETVQVVDWREAANNDFILVSQLWITGDLHTRRADLIGFVNGLPLLFIELKAAHRRLKHAFDDNLRDYRDTIPHLLHYSAFLILSNGSESRLGTLTSPWEQFSEWTRINDEGERGVVSLETMLRATCAPARLLDLVENFILFREGQGGLHKLVARNHQYLGVNNAIEAVREIGANRGRLGVFWHTQGSGKSYSMLFFAQKILRVLPGNWTFLIVTDRTDLDDQIYKNFAGAGALKEDEATVRAQSAADLKQKLHEDHRYLFTTIQKFRTEGGAPYPTLSKRDDIIVITDEAHRSQYDIFAGNMRRALPNAAFIGFTGTPLMAGEERTRELFGDYVSIYDFKRSVEERATVPLFYENRIPELQLTNDALNCDMADLIEAAELDDEQEAKLEREFAREYHLITRDDRLDAIAGDIVSHFLGRGHQGKAMVVSIDKLTTVRLFEKVRAAWQRELARLKRELASGAGREERDEQALRDRIRYVEATDMAVVVSQGQNEVDDFRRRGLDILSHRERMVREPLDKKFKEPDDPLRLVFVCAMWIIGFDVPSLSTIYLDKPMRNHTLMQTIARANRLFGEKQSGLIVDYIGVFRNLQRALAIYGSGAGGAATEGEYPVQPKEALLDDLQRALGEAIAFLRAHGVEHAPILAASGFGRVALLDEAVERIIVNDEAKRRFLALAGAVDALFKAILPDARVAEHGRERALLGVLAGKIRTLAPETEITAVMDDVETLLDASVAAESYGIRERAMGNIVGLGENDPAAHRLDLSKIDFEALKALFQQGRKRTAAEQLRGQLNQKLAAMVRLNRSRLDYLQRFQAMIEAYNAGATDIDLHFQQLLAFSDDLSEEAQRHIAEQLSEEELALFDLLTRPQLDLTREERKRVKAVARGLLATLKNEKLVLDWRKRQQSRAAVQLAIANALDALPDAYAEALYREKVSALYQHIHDAYAAAEQSIYQRAG